MWGGIFSSGSSHPQGSEFTPVMSLPVKIVARLLFRVKYIWVTPWFSI